MTTPALLASLDDLKGRLDWTLDTDEERIANSALEDASDLARYYAGKDWDDPEMAPRMARTLVLRACKRYMTNPDGYTQSRAGDEALAWGDSAGENAGSVYFTADEIVALRGLGGAGPPTVMTAGLTAWGTVRSGGNPRPRNGLTPGERYEVYREGIGFVPVDGSGAGFEKPFPLFDNDCAAW